MLFYDNYEIITYNNNIIFYIEFLLKYHAIEIVFKFSITRISCALI